MDIFNYNAQEIEDSEASDITIIALSDGQGREVRISPAAGFNAYSFTIPHQGDSLDIFIPLNSRDLLRQGGFAFGTPILFPFPNRTRNGHYTFNGKEYQLDINWKDGHAIHGLVADRAWQVVEIGANDGQGAFATARFVTADDPDVVR